MIGIIQSVFSGIKCKIKDNYKMIIFVYTYMFLNNPWVRGIPMEMRQYFELRNKIYN